MRHAPVRPVTQVYALLACAALFMAACAPSAPAPAAPAKPPEAAKAAPPAASPAASPSPSPAASPAAAPSQVDTKAIGDFFSGKTIRIVVGFAAGGGYDVYARLIARFFGSHIPG